MGTEYPETAYYYAVRNSGVEYEPAPNTKPSKSLVEKWDIVLLIRSYTTRKDGVIYIQDENGVDQLYYVQNITWEDYDMLDAFGVPAVNGFHSHYWHVHLSK